MEGIRKYGLFLIVFGLTGCRPAPEAPFPDWLAAPPATDRPADSQDLNRAAELAERIAGDDALRVSFTPGRADALVHKLTEPVALALRAVRAGQRPSRRFGPPFEALPYQKGWGLIGKAMVFRIESLAALGEGAKAVDAFVGAARFGLALTAGAASDASQGYQTLENSIEALEPMIPQLTANDWRALGTGIEAALGSRPRPQEVVENERQSMLASVQFIQDAFRDRKLGILTQELGKAVEPAVEALDRLHGKGSDRRADYFAGFAAEAEVWVDHFETVLTRNARQRAAMPEFELKGDRPWRRFSRHFFSGLGALVPQRDRAICRLRLLALEALLRAECRKNGSAPSTLAGISADLTTDPYRGSPFVFRPEQNHFLLYSVGPDLRDDGGEWGADIRVGR